MGKIYKWSFRYAIGKIHVSISQRLFFKSIVVTGVENIPKNRPVLFAPNHQNALMDAIAIVCKAPGQTVFMARSDIFKNSFAAKLLRFLKIMPVYRIRDGYSSLGKNEEVFDEAFEVLANNKSLCIMPEGTHNLKHFLLPLVKGPFRLVFSFIEKFPDSLKPVIIPVGLHYKNYKEYRGETVINFGKPIDTGEYVEIYKQSAPKAINMLKDRVAEELKSLMINIECGEYYESVNFLRLLYRPVILGKKTFSKNKVLSKFEADCWFVSKCNEAYKYNPDSISSMAEDAKKLKEVLTKYQINPESFFRKQMPAYKHVGLLILLIFGYPVFIFGRLSNYPPLLAAPYLLKKIKDPQFISSVRYTLATFLFPLWYIILLIIIYFVSHNFLVSLAAIFIIAILGEISFWLKTQMFFFDEETKLRSLRKKISFKEWEIKL